MSYFIDLVGLAIPALIPTLIIAAFASYVLSLDAIDDRRIPLKDILGLLILALCYLVVVLTLKIYIP